MTTPPHKGMEAFYLVWRVGGITHELLVHDSMKELGIIVVNASSSSEDSLQKFAAWMAVQTKIITIEGGTNPVQQLSKQSLDSGSVSFLAISADTLVRIFEAESDPALLQKFLETQCEKLLVFSCSGSPSHRHALSALTRGIIQDISV